MDLQQLKEEYPDLTNNLIQEGITQGIQQERQRISNILSSSTAKGRDNLAQHLAFATDMPSEQALALLDKSPQESIELKQPINPKKDQNTLKQDQTGFLAAMNSITNPEIIPAQEPLDTEEDKETIAKRIAAHY